MRKNPVIEEGADLFDLELPREAVDDAVWHIRKIFKEGAKEPSRAKLDGKAQTVVVAAVGVYEPSIAVIQVEVTGQLFLGLILRQSDRTDCAAVQSGN